MIQLLVGLVLAIWLTYGFIQVLIGLSQITVGVFLMVTGAALYVAAVVLEFGMRGISLLIKR